MKNGILTLDWASIADALVTAVVFAVLMGLYQVVIVSGFDLFSADWGLIGRTMANLGFVAGVVSLAQNILSTNTGSVLNITPEVQP